ncbi:hypothetical protein A5790_10395 [Mycobacterium sp. 852002-51152_SCH6134967]|uniref:hypothetical protein n=1 Tax=Mycobacterium sp. 852002-51152_SCH6134967 TaxID=1834096 RepID=UPI00080005D1|nr:hypothetical protein [Mycobacterium sp. 852002-51152_SCH6134967]OBF94489.1 hypothetical protein A5790_10395 [Mycobacterium sp. 852002-51152_SCH6134967]
MSSYDFPEAPHRGRLLDARLHLLDRQLVVGDGDPVGIVDDLEIDGITAGADIDKSASPPTVSAILTGDVLITRIFGGRPPVSRMQSIAWRAVAEVHGVIQVDIDDTDLDPPWIERWLRERLMVHIPGGRHAAE